MLPATNFNGTGLVYLPIPNGVSAGLQFFVQSLTIDPPANGLGATFSNAAAATVGVR